MADEFWKQPRIVDALASLPEYRSKGMRIAGQLRGRGLNRLSPTEPTIGAPMHAIAEAVVGKDHVGYWGQVWALGLLWSLVAKGADPKLANSAQLAEHVCKSLSKPFPEHELADTFKNTKKEKDRLLTTPARSLQYLLGTGNLGQSHFFPSSEMSRQVRNEFAKFVLDALYNDDGLRPEQSQNINDFINELDSPKPTVQECFISYVSHLGLTARVHKREDAAKPLQVGYSYIDSKMWDYVASNRRTAGPPAPYQGDEKLGDVFGHLMQIAQGNGPRGAVLLGNAHDGKKSVIGDFLKTLYEPTKPIQFHCSRGQDKLELPVLCLSAADCDIYELFVHVIIFFDRIRGKVTELHEVAVEERLHTFDLLASPPDIDTLSKQLEDLLQDEDTPPALVILVDVETRTDELRRMIRRNDTTRLLGALCRGQRDNSRLLLTASECPELPGVTPKTYTMPQPVGQQLSWYLNAEQNQVFKTPEFQSKIAHLLYLPCSGKLLLALGVLVGHKSYPAPTFASLMGLAITLEERKAGDGLVLVCKAIVRLWEQDKLLPWAALIMASEDGMTEETLKECLTDWRNHDPKLEALDADSAVVRLRDLSHLSQGFFLERTNSTSFFEEEARHDEQVGATHVDLLAFETSCAAALRAAVKQSKEFAREKTIRMANRYVAIQARRRARYRSLSWRVLRRSGQQVPERTVQSLIALLLSIEKIEDPQPLPKNMDLRLLSDRVFTVDPDKFDPIIALNYVVQIMLRQEADQGNKMSMSLDTDKLRLSVYALLFAPIGVRRTWENGVIEPDKLPIFMKESLALHLNCFSLSDQAGLLTSLGMAAHYSGHFPILFWAEWQVIQLEGKYGSLNELALAKTRLAAARLDLEMRIGSRSMAAKYLAKTISAPAQDLGESTKNESDFDTQSNVSSRPISTKSPNFRKVKRAIEGGFDTSGPKSGVGALEFNWRKYLTNIAPALEQMDPKAVGVTAFDRLVVRFYRLQSFAGSIDNLPPNHTSVQGRLGRTGRIALELELHGFPYFFQKEEIVSNLDTLVSHADTLLHANITRLTVYGGAERSLVTIDLALALLLRRDYEAAIRAAREAKNLALRGTAGYAIKLEILLSQVAITLCAVESGAEQNSLYSVATSFEYLDQIAKSFTDGPTPISVIINALRARNAMALGETILAQGFCEKARQEAVTIKADGLLSLTGSLAEKIKDKTGN